jgi:hypothetical protein
MRPSGDPQFDMPGVNYSLLKVYAYGMFSIVCCVHEQEHRIFIAKVHYEIKRHYIN